MPSSFKWGRPADWAKVKKCLGMAMVFETHDGRRILVGMEDCRILNSSFQPTVAGGVEGTEREIIQQLEQTPLLTMGLRVVGKQVVIGEAHDGAPELGHPGLLLPGGSYHTDDAESRSRPRSVAHPPAVIPPKPRAAAEYETRADPDGEDFHAAKTHDASWLYCPVHTDVPLFKPGVTAARRRCPKCRKSYTRVQCGGPPGPPPRLPGRQRQLPDLGTPGQTKTNWDEAQKTCVCAECGDPIKQGDPCKYTNSGCWCELCARSMLNMHPHFPPVKPKRTRKIRVPVFIDSDGRWQAGPAWSSELGKVTPEMEQDFKTTCYESGDHVGPNATFVWLEAEVELPKETTKQAEVRRDGD